MMIIIFFCFYSLIPEANTLLSLLNSNENIASLCELNFATITDKFKSQIKIVASDPPEARNRPQVENLMTLIALLNVKLFNFWLCAFLLCCKPYVQYTV